MSDLPAKHVYTVRVDRGEGGWEVHIVDEHGSTLTVRRSPNEGDAMTFASTVRQHLHWLSRGKFRQYYRLDEPAERTG
jgi:hypothetical protein